VYRTAGITIVTALLFALLLAPGCAPQAEQPKQAELPAGPQAEVATFITLMEGPTVDGAGNVYFTDIRGNTIWKYAADKTTSVFRHPSNRANGMIFDLEGRLVVVEGSDAEIDQPRITRTNMATGESEVIAESFEGKRLNQPNDVTIDSQGRLYFSDRPLPNPKPDQTGINAVYRLDPDGTIARILAEPGIERPNGLVISPDDKTFYLVEAHPDEGHARMIRAHDLQPDGTLTNVRIFHDFYPGRSADGIAVDSEGNIYAAAGLNRTRGTSETLDTRCGVYVFSPDGALKQFTPIDEDLLTNVAFGGPDMRTVYVTAGKTLFTFRAEIPGTRR
jgi:gluconolactonase